MGSARRSDLSHSAWITSRVSGASRHAPRSTIASAASRSNPPENTAVHASAMRSHGSNRPHDQSMARRKVACRADVSRRALDRRSKRRGKRSRIAAGDNVRPRAAASSIAKGIPVELANDLRNRRRIGGRHLERGLHLYHPRGEQRDSLARRNLVQLRVARRNRQRTDRQHVLALRPEDRGSSRGRDLRSRSVHEPRTRASGSMTCSALSST